MANIKTVTAKVYRTECVGTSIYGNPYYRVVTDSGTYRTSIDAGVNYEITNHIGKRKTFIMTQAGRISGIKRK